MSTVLFKRGTETEMNETPITDGLLYFCTSNNKIYMDNGNMRLQYGGDTTLISNPSQANPANAFNAQASINLFAQKTTIVDTKSGALAVTQSYIPLGCLAFKEMLGTDDYSNVGNGTVSGALVSLRGETLEGTLAAAETNITLTSQIINNNSYIDVYTDSYAIVPKNVIISGNQIRLTFDAQVNPVAVRVIVKNM